jgi:hypothetical protein
VNWVVSEIDDAGIDLESVIHASTVEDNAAIGQQKKVREERETTIEVE